MTNAILFDIDGTLLHAKGLGRPAFAAAFQDAYGVEVDLSATSFVGATDTAIIRGLAKACGVESTPAKEEAFAIALTQRLDPRLKAGPLFVYPGVRKLLPALREAGYRLGIVTGNIRTIAWSKLLHSGLAENFTFGAYASDHEDRDVIAAIAKERARALKAEARLLIGDTPKDVQAAHAIGCPCLAVTTGWVDEETLKHAGADACIAGFADIENALRVIQELTRG